MTQRIVLFVALLFAALIAGGQYVVWWDYNAAGMSSTFYTEKMQHAIRVIATPLFSVQCTAALLVIAAAPLTIPEMPSWTRPTAPFRIVGPIHYVGTKGIGVYLIRTSEGLILLDGGLEENVPAIEANIAALGFKLRQ